MAAAAAAAAASCAAHRQELPGHQKQSENLCRTTGQSPRGNTTIVMQRQCGDADETHHHTSHTHSGGRRRWLYLL
eukprot:SAG25_NODE_974_length_4472_cov_2.144523_1_plen_75_part_00